MKDNIVSHLIEIRILVLTLGESHHSGWWKSQFMSPTGLSFLERIYPRSAFSAAVRSASRGAKFVHDTNVGKGEVFHLFRLSPEIERKLDLALEVQATNLMSRYQSLLADQKALLTTLEKLTDHREVPQAAGPTRLPFTENWLGIMAGLYLVALRDGSQVYPYIEEKIRL